MSGGTPALTHLRRAGIPHRVHEYAADEKSGDRVAYGVAAATALGVEPARMFKTLVVTLQHAMSVASADPTLVRKPREALALIPADREASLKAIAQAMSARGAELMLADAVHATTGYVIGGVSPFGTKRQLPVVVDVSVYDHAQVYLSAGKRGLAVEMRPADLIAELQATVAPIVSDLVHGS